MSVWLSKLRILVEMSESQRRLNQETKDKYPAKDVVHSYAKAMRRAKEAMAKYSQKYYRKQRAILGLRIFRKKARLAMPKWRTENISAEQTRSEKK